MGVQRMNDNKQPVVRDSREATINWEVLEALLVLRKPGGPDPRARLIKVFLSSSPTLMDSLRTAHRNSDPEALAQAAHSMKSSSMNLGATELGNLCAELERIGRSGSMEKTGDLLAMAESEYASVATAFEKIVSENEN
jgi:HPt (histidine-containing phosphotransfer) domain-containing protein